MACVSRLNDTALALAVYASDTPVARRSRKTRFPLLANSTGWDWLPTGFDRKVSTMFLHRHPPFPGFAWRNTPCTPPPRVCRGEGRPWTHKVFND
jgi:hypothetical protein